MKTALLQEKRSMRHPNAALCATPRCSACAQKALRREAGWSIGQEAQALVSSDDSREGRA
jgi:hypothetical protein